MNANMIYDSKIEPFYESKILHNNKKILLYDLDNHSNNTILSKKTYIIEYYTPKNECLILPKCFAEKLYLTDDKILSAYFKTQQEGRHIISKNMKLLSIISLIYFILVIINLFLTNELLQKFLLLSTIPFVIYYVYSYFFYKNKVSKYTNKLFIKALTDSYSKGQIKNNINDIIEKAKILNYMHDKQKLRTINNFENLSKFIENTR
ncbi:MAG: hypothetical protein ACK5NF_05180 [Bacilli bacterium]